MDEPVMVRLQQCLQRRQWYGPEGLASEVERTDARLNHTFLCQKATEGQIRQTERLLGFALPSLLVTLYRSLANGGFGPGYGLRGMVGGYGTSTTPLGNGEIFQSDETMVKYHRNVSSLIPLAFEQETWMYDDEGQPYITLPVNLWPASLAPLCDLGDVQEIGVDTPGLVYLLVSDQDERLNRLYRVGTLADWLAQWSNSTHSTHSLGVL